MKFIHLTDTHLTLPGNTLYDLNPLTRLQAAVESINSEHADADFCVITGDLTHTAQPEAYAALRETLAQCKVPVHVLMGNHDARETVLEYFPTLPCDSNGFIQYTIDTDAGVFVLMDTVEAGTHAGRYCAARREWLASVLEHAHSQSRDVFLFAHHPPFELGLGAMDDIGMADEDATALNALLGRYRHVRHLFFGHIHRPISGHWQGISFSTLRGTNHQVAFDMHTTDMIPGSHEPPAYCVVLAEQDRLIVHYHDFLDDSLRFPLGTVHWEDWNMNR